MSKLDILAEIPFDTIVDYLDLSPERVKQLLRQGQVYNCPQEGIIITLERYDSRTVSFDE